MLFSGVQSNSEVALIAIKGIKNQPGIAAKVFGAIAEEKINVELILQSIGRGENKDISFVVAQDEADHAVETLKKAFDEADYEDIISDKEVGIVSIVGAGMMSNSGAASKMFEALYNRGINIHLIYTSEIKITVLIKESRVERAVEALKEATSLPIDLHTHYTSGVASMTYMKAVEAGVDMIDTAISPFALGTSQPATEVMVETFKGSEYDTGLDMELLGEIADYFRPIREDAIDTGLLNPRALGVNIKTLMYQVPGGMLSNLLSQLEEQKASDKYYEVLAEIPRVRKDFGEPPLVTPSSQIVGTQAVLNVLAGERYKMITKESKDLLAGKYGQTVKPVNKEIQKKAIGDEKPITCRLADTLDPELEKLEKEMAQWKEQDEDVLSYALFPQVATDFFKYRAAQKNKIDLSKADVENGAYPV